MYPGHPKRNFFCLGSPGAGGRPLRFSPATRVFLLSSGVAPLLPPVVGEAMADSIWASIWTASRIVRLERHKTICSLNARSLAAWGRLQMGQSHHSSSGFADCFGVGLGAISFPCRRCGVTSPAAPIPSLMLLLLSWLSPY